MSKQKQRVVPNLAQRRTLDYIRIRLAETGYLIFPLPEWYRRSESSFLAVDKERPVRFLAVQPTLKGWVSLTPFGQKSLYTDVANLLSASRDDAPATMRLMNIQMAYEKIKDNWWSAYFPPGAQEELRRLNIV